MYSNGAISFTKKKQSMAIRQPKKISKNMHIFNLLNAKNYSTQCQANSKDHGLINPMNP
jgi:hypothetical protein